MTRTLSQRIPKELAQRIAERAERWAAANDSEVYRRVIEEWVRLQEYPGIRFVDGPAGRRAALVGGPDVWEAIAIGRAHEFHLERLAGAYPWLTPEALDAARRYHAAYPDEIDGWIGENSGPRRSWSASSRRCAAEAPAAVRLYLDEMISPTVAEALRERRADAVAAAERGALGLSDAAQLARAIHEERALATYNIRDYVLLSRAAASAGREHWGIVLIGARRIPTSDIGGLVRALQAVLAERSAADALMNRTIFLPAPSA